MAAALERLLSAQETQMSHIENPSTSLGDHLEYWGAVREENALLHAARKRHVRFLGPCPVPTLATSADAAKFAIEMQILLSELLQTQWGKDAWSLGDVSRERYTAAPAYTLKKKPRIAEVVYDGDEANRNWYTVWGEVYLREKEGWTLTVGGVDELGLYYTMHGQKMYYQFFSEDAERFSATGHWQVTDRDQSYVFPPTSMHRDTPDGPGRGEPEPRSADGASASEGPFAAEPVTSSRCASGGPPGRVLSTGQRGGARHHPYGVPGGKGVSVPSCSAPSLQSAVSTYYPQASQGGSRASSPDTTANGGVTGANQDEGGFDLFQGLLTSPCVLITGNGNKVKCYRHRLKKHHRQRFTYVTTTFWATGDGSDRHGHGTILVTFPSTDSRQLFLDTVSIPAALTARSVTVSAE
ncbi:E2 early protein [Bos taurus papillomavirus 32]|nr:E2 early protein [Bos taurus papillomavirus 32]